VSPRQALRAVAGWLCIVGTLACWPSSPLSQLQAPEPDGARPTLHLISVGVAEYGTPALRQAGADEDARRVARAMTELAAPFYTMRTHTLVGPAATRAALVATLDSVHRMAGPRDLVALYFRGLGGPRFLVLADTAQMPAAPRNPGELPPASFEARILRHDVLSAWLLDLPARQILLVLESPEGSSFFHNLREPLAAPPAALRATKDLAAFATPGAPTARTFAEGESGVLTAAFVASLEEERAARGVALSSTLAARVVDRLDSPIVVHEAGADLVLGTDSAAHSAADALRDTTRWSGCERDCPTLTLDGVENVYTLVGRARGLEAGAKLFVNGRRARLEGDRFEVELPPAALRAELSLRVLGADYRRFEERQRLP
jgi:hypothetical protein